MLSKTREMNGKSQKYRFQYSVFINTTHKPMEKLKDVPFPLSIFNNNTYKSIRFFTGGVD